MIHIFYGRFPLGLVFVMPGVLEATTEDERISALTRHISGDWGDLPAVHKTANDEALKGGERLISAYYTSAGVKLWIITEADRSATTFLLPAQY